MDTRSRTKGKQRAREAEQSVGPIGNLLASPAVAQLLLAFLKNPDERMTLGEIKERTGKRAKGTVQAGLQALMASRLVRREGGGNRASYRYAADRELGRRMADLIQASQREAAIDTTSDIPWLSDLMSTAPGAPISKPFGERIEDVPSAETTERVLAAGEAIDDSTQPRLRPGLRTRA